MTLKRTFFPLLFAALVFVPSSLFAQKIVAGMTKADLAKAFPAKASLFNSTSKGISAERFLFYGMTGRASFEFTKGKLSLFFWQMPEIPPQKAGVRPPKPRNLTPAETSQYVLLVHQLQYDYGKGTSQPSPFNHSALDCSWKFGRSIAEIEYHPNGVKFTLVDKAVMQKAESIPH